VKVSHLLEIQDEWCREMAKLALHDAEEISEQLTVARGKRLARQSPEMIPALDREIALLQRIREELESDVESWVHDSRLQTVESAQNRG
jgi:hypothetical protein